jgi:ABC-type lipoprotein export system ATPase subunit
MVANRTSRPTDLAADADAAAMPLIQLRDIYKTYHLGELDVPVLKGISLAVQRGEMVALMGASGSGKSTLMNILGCLDHPSAGQYWLDGEEVSRLSADQRALVRNRKIGFVFQSFNLLPRTSALENVVMPLSYTAEDLPDREARQRGTELLARVGLADRMHHEPSQLSGGQQQRVAIARALVNHPSLLFADEPTGNLDSHTSHDVLRMFQQINHDQGITIIIVTHDAGVAQHAQRIIRISDGVIADGAVPAHNDQQPASAVAAGTAAVGGGS